MRLVSRLMKTAGELNRSSALAHRAHRGVQITAAIQSCRAAISIRRLTRVTAILPGPLIEEEQPQYREDLHRLFVDKAEGGCRCSFFVFYIRQTNTLQ